MSYCIACRYQIDATDRFCEDCGAVQPVNENSPQQHDVPAPAAKPSTRKRMFANLVGLAVGVAIFGALLFLAWNLPGDNNGPRYDWMKK